MVSADISGFTRLSERLAQHGPAGAEEMTDILNSYFDGVIAAAERLGGDVLKFGGDQVLVWFTDDGHEQRAAAACVGMRAAADRPFATGWSAGRCGCACPSARTPAGSRS